MPRLRKTDKYKELEGRGRGCGSNYTPWIKVHEFGSSGRVHRVVGWKYSRVYQFMSDLEFHYFLLLQWNDDIKDIREQYPLLPMEDTILISEELGFKHPPKTKINKTVMTTDFILLVKSENTLNLVARTVKPSKDLENKRNLEKFMIEERYWRKRGIDWGVVTERDIDETIAKNIASLYQDYFWNMTSENREKYKDREIIEFTKILKKSLEQNSFDLRKSLSGFSPKLGWSIEEALCFTRYLLVKKIAKTNFKEKLNFNDMKVYID